MTDLRPEAVMVENGIEVALERETAALATAIASAIQTEKEVVTIDKTSTANVIYLEFLSGKIKKINKADLSNVTILTAQTGGTWANRATTNVYTKGGM